MQKFIERPHALRDSIGPKRVDDDSPWWKNVGGFVFFICVCACSGVGIGTMGVGILHSYQSSHRQTASDGFTIGPGQTVTIGSDGIPSRNEEDDDPFETPIVKEGSALWFGYMCAQHGVEIGVCRAIMHRPPCKSLAQDEDGPEPGNECHGPF